MSAATKSNKGVSNNNFETYRQIAPETVDDQRLRDIIKNNKNEHSAIVAAIENIWHDTPDQKAVGSDWVTTSKAKKTEAAPAKSFRDAGRRDGAAGGRGGAGRGRSLPPAGGRGGGDGRGAPRAASVKAPTGRDSPAVRASPVVEEADVEESVEVAPEPVVAPAPAAVVAPVVAPTTGGVAWGRGGSLAQKLKEAEKQKEVEKVKVETQPTVQEEVPVASAPVADATAEAQKAAGRSARGPRRPRGASAGAAPAAEKRSAEEEAAAVTELIETTEALALSIEEKIEEVVAAEVPPPPPLVQVSAAPVEVSAPAAAETATSTTVQQGFLNMGKWEAPVESADISAFQFGSFGNVYGEDDSANSGVSASQVGTNPSAAPWTGLHSEDKTNVWGTTSEQSLDMSGGLFAQQGSSSANKVEAPADVAMSTGSVAATRAPPGLAQNKNTNNNASSPRPVGQQTKKNETAPQQAQQGATQLPAYHQQQQPNYNQQGIPPGMNNRTPLGVNPLAGGLPYPYNPTFDLLAQQQAAAQYGGYPLPQVPALAPAAGAATSSASSTTSSTAATASTAAGAAAPNAALAQQQAQQQQYAQQAPYPYPYNPYYPNQAYYYGQHQMPNFYGQGRDMYQQRPYGNNPYGNAGSLYPGDVYGQQGAGQFPDASGNYGGLPVHPGMQGTNTGAVGAANAAGNKAAKGANAGNVAGAVGGAGTAQGMNPDQHTANLLMNSGYGYVNPYNQPRDGWQQQQQQGGYPGSQQAGWPMMYPGSSSPSTIGGVGAGFAPQQNAGAAQGQQGQGNNNNNRGNNNTYGNNNSFGGRGAGGAAPAPAGGVTQNW